MSDAFLVGIVIDLISDPIGYIGAMFTFVNLKYIFVTMLIITFLATNFGGINKKGFRKMKRGMPNWGFDKLRQMSQNCDLSLTQFCQRISKKGIDVKDFQKYSEMDVENITITNTLIHTYYKYTYDMLAPKTEVGEIRILILNFT